VSAGRTKFWANVVIDTIRNPDGSLLGFAKITRDITERMRPASVDGDPRGADPGPEDGGHWASDRELLMISTIC